MSLTRGFLVLFTVVLAACSSSVPQSLNAEALVGTQWRVETLDGSDLLTGTELSVLFAAEGRASGSGGCNRYLATWEGDGASLDIEVTGASKRLCHDPAGIMDQETRFLAALGETTSFSEAEGRLTLLDGAAKHLLTLEVNADAN